MKPISQLKIILLIGSAFLFYRFFISTSLFVAHDWPLLFKESRDFPFWNLAWDYTGGVGLGSPAFKTLWVDLYTNLTYSISNLINIPWWISQRIFWIVPFVLLTLLSSYKFAGLFIKEPLFRILSAIIYSFNSYILLIVGGGQFGIAFAYGISPLVFYHLINLFKEPRFSNIILPALLSGVLIAFDPRISLLTFILFGTWYVVFIKDFSFRRLRIIFLIFTIALLLNSYWIFPILMTKDSLSSLSSYASLEGLKFLSFANFSNSFSLLHPNWPENIFGKVYFMRAEFLIFPILAYSSLLLLNKSKVKNQKSKVQVKIQNFNNSSAIGQFNNRTVLFFALLSLVGAFLAKGTNEPFGQIYIWAFEHLPGFALFRDSTKFYIFIAIAYSILIPYSLQQYFYMLKKYKYLMIVIFFIYWLFLLKPAWTGELNGIFKPTGMPQDYQILRDFLKADQSFSRTLWIPKREKFGFFDPNHPAVDADVLFKSVGINLLKKFNMSKKDLPYFSIKYIIVPYDTDGEIFLTDRKYDEKQYKDTIQYIESIKGLKETGEFGKIKVLELENYKDHFWSPSAELRISYNFLSPSEYKVEVQNAKKGDLLVFSEGFDGHWTARNSNVVTQSLKFRNGLNSFILLKDGNYDLKIYYEPQKWVNIGLAISGVTFVLLITMVIGFRLRKMVK